VRAPAGSRGITAPLMVVKGDGSLIADRSALARPVETVPVRPGPSVSAPLADRARGLFVSISRHHHRHRHPEGMEGRC